MARTKAVKQKKLTVAELKRRMVEGTVFTMVDFHGTPVKKRRVVAGISTTFVKLSGDEIKEGDHSYMNWPKSTELTGNDEGFTIKLKYGTIRYVWGEVNSETDQVVENTPNL